MNKIVTLAFLFIIALNCYAQDIHIPDTVLLNTLISKGYDLNNDGIIQIDETEHLDILYLTDLPIQSLEGVNEFMDLEHLRIERLDIESIELNGAPKLRQVVLINNDLLTTVSIQNIESLGHLVCKRNDIEELELIGLTNLRTLYCSGKRLSELDVKGLKNLQELECQQNDLRELDVAGLKNLTQLNCGLNSIQQLEYTGCEELTVLTCSSNHLSNLDLSEFRSLEYFYCRDNNLTHLDFSNNPLLSHLLTSGNNLIQLNFKNGSIWPKLSPGIFQENPNLAYICADEVELEEFEDIIENSLDANCVLNTYCNFVPGGGIYTHHARLYLDVESDGCDTTDSPVNQFAFRIYQDSVYLGKYFYQNSGYTTLNFQTGQYSIIPEFTGSNLFVITPDTVDLSFPADSSNIETTFCLQPRTPIEDVEVVILPGQPLRPGSSALVRIKYKNVGNQIMSGTLELSYDSEIMSFESAIPNTSNQSAGLLEWTYSDLLPFESRTIEVSFLLNSPMDDPPLVGGEDISLRATIYPLDDHIKNNLFTLDQTVVNSFDPNNKTCLQGNRLHPDKLDDEVYYMIRFENTGTAEAINVVVKDVIDTTRFDINSLQPIDGSHDFFTRVQQGNVVEFIFEEIYLPFDDANNDGYVVFKINPKQGLGIGDTLINDAEIYFDFNFPVITAPAVTQITNLSSSTAVNQEVELRVHPNPARDMVTIECGSAILSLELIDLNGRTIRKQKVDQSALTSKFHVGDIATGVYQLVVGTSEGPVVRKLTLLR